MEMRAGSGSVGLDRLRISDTLSVPLSELIITAVRAQGAGGQNVNKVATAAHLRFDIKASSLPENCKQALLLYPDRRISRDGVVVIKSQSARSLERNRADAIQRLRRLIQAATRPRASRIPTKPSRAAQARRLEDKTRRGRLKRTRLKVKLDD